MSLVIPKLAPFETQAFTRQENAASFHAQENELRFSVVFLLISVTLFKKWPKAADSKMKTTHRVELGFLNFRLV